MTRVKRWRSVVWVVAACLLQAAVAAAQAQAKAKTGSVDGVVSTQDGSVRLPGATVAIYNSAGEQVAEQLTNAEGTFTALELQPDIYRFVSSLMGFRSAEAKVAVTAGGTGKIALDMPLADISEHVEVRAPIAAGPTGDTIAPTSGVTGKELDQFSPSSGVAGALRLLASVITVPGGVSIKGGRSNQTGVQMGAGSLTDPTTGLSTLTLPADAIGSVDVLPNPYAVEFGRFSSGVVVIETRRAEDRWSVRLNDLDPNFRTARDNPAHITGLLEFAPRFEGGGPVIPQRLFVEQTAQFRYLTSDVASLPETELSIDRWFSTLTRADANLTPRHSLIALGGVFANQQSEATLGTFVPPLATVKQGNHLWHVSASEHASWTDWLLSDTTVRIQAGVATITPQGIAPMAIKPETIDGNFFNSQSRSTSTVQWVSSLSTSHEGPLGTRHLLKVGIDTLFSQYDGTSTSQPVIIETTSGTPTRRLDFNDETFQHVGSTDLALFAQDRIQAGPRVYIEAGGRLDRDGVLNQWNVTPRAGTAIVLDRAGNAVIRGGFGRFFERTPSVAAAFGQFESPDDTRFAADGVTPLAPPARVAFVTAPNLKTARSSSWNLSYEHRLNSTWAVHASVLERRGSSELILDPTRAPTGPELLLSSTGTSVYRDAEVGVRFTHAPGFDVTATYVRSSSRGDLNPFTNFFGTILWPIVGANAYGPTSADVPDRLLVRGRLSTPRWLFLEIVDWRSGSPYSVVDQALDYVGQRNANRFPNAMHVELGGERRVHVGRFRPWLGLRVNNPFNNFAPSDVQSNITSPAFGSFYNSEYRRLRIIIRFAR